MIKLLLGRLLPAGAAIGLLFSSASPLHPALMAFESAGNALGGVENEDTSHIAMPDEKDVEKALGDAADPEKTLKGFSGGFSLKKFLSRFFGPSDSDKAKAQLDTIIASVKARSANASAAPTADPKGAQAGQAPAKGAKGGAKSGTAAKGAAAPGKAPPKPAAAPAQPAEPAAPAPAPEPGGEAAAGGAGEGP